MIEHEERILVFHRIIYKENSFRDIAVGEKEFNNQDSELKDLNGDKLILDVIEQVCTFGDKK